MILTIEAIKRKLAELKERGGGLPDRPRFIPFDLSVLLIEKTAPIRPFIVKYTELLLDTKQPQPIDVSKLQYYRENAEILRHSTDVICRAWGAFMADTLDRITKLSDVAISGEIDEINIRNEVERFYISLRALQNIPVLIDGESDEYKRLASDEAAFEQWRANCLSKIGKEGNENESKY
jgi:hypothetical protein